MPCLSAPSNSIAAAEEFDPLRVRRAFDQMVLRCAIIGGL